MLGARRRDLKSRVSPGLSQCPDDRTNRISRPEHGILPVAIGLSEWVIGKGEREPGGSRVRRDHLVVIGASDDPPRPRSGLRGFGNTRHPPIVKMLATQIQSTRPASITPTITHSIFHPKPHPPSASPHPPAHLRAFYPPCCSLTLHRSTCTQMPLRLPCACSRYNHSSPQPKSCARQ